jgi:hypothetical protein
MHFVRVSENLSSTGPPNGGFADGFIRAAFGFENDSFSQTLVK